MDSISQAALGAAVGVAVMGRHQAAWKAALWGAVVGTLPDLDALVDHGDPVSNMTFHRAESHALFWLTLATTPIALAIARLNGQVPLWRRWWVAVWLALVTHPLLDAMTVYGTQLLLPFSDHPVALGSIFIIDPLYTLPLLAGVALALRRRDARGRAWNAAGLGLSCAYLAWTAVAQAWVRHDVDAALAMRGLPAERVLVTPAPFNSLLWRVVVVGADGRYHEGFRSLLDGARALQLDAFDQGRALITGPLAQRWHVQRLLWFSRGFHKAAQTEAGVVITDLRMGQEPGYVFAFVFGPGDTSLPRAAGGRLDLSRGLRWLGPRMLGADLPPPR